MSLPFLPMENSPPVSSVSNVSDSNTTSTVEVSSASVPEVPPPFLYPIIWMEVGLLFPLKSQKTG